jgi:hypothetical protein
MGVLDMVPFVGKSFNLFYPVTLIILIIFNLLELDSKVLKLFKISIFDERELEQQKILDGVKVLEDMEKNSVCVKNTSSLKAIVQLYLILGVY